MKEILKDYGPLIGPFLAFTLGIIAIFIKFNIDKHSAKSETRKKVTKLVELVTKCRFEFEYGQYKENLNVGKLTAENAQTLLRAVIGRYLKNLKLIVEFAAIIEKEVFINCSLQDIGRYHTIKNTIETQKAQFEIIVKQLSGQVSAEEWNKFVQPSFIKQIDNLLKNFRFLHATVKLMKRNIFNRWRHAPSFEDFL